MKLGSFIAGMGVGAVGALVFAPKSGEDTREILSKKVEEGKQYAKGRAQEIRSLATDTVEQGKKPSRARRTPSLQRHKPRRTHTRANRKRKLPSRVSQRVRPDKPMNNNNDPERTHLQSSQDRGVALLG